jgi:Terminase small subunit
MPKFKRLNQRQEVFAQGVAAGLSGVEAFKRATPGNPKDCDVKANQMRGQPGVEERIKELMRENDKKATLSREQMLAWLTRVITTGAGSVIPTDSLCQAHKHTAGDGWEADEIRLPDKLAAATQLAKMCDWNSPERVELRADTLSKYLLELRARPFMSEGVFELEQPAALLKNANSEESCQDAGE